MDIAGNEILLPAQKHLLSAFARSRLAGTFYLSGGTALSAFHLRHRVSDDLDFFTELEVPVEAVLDFLGGLNMGAPDYHHLFDRRIFLRAPATPRSPASSRRRHGAGFANRSTSTTDSLAGPPGLRP